MKLASPLTLKDIAGLLGLDYVGNEDHQISGLNEIHKVEEGDLTFVDHPKYYERALQSAATTVLINQHDVECPEGKAVLISDDPFTDYNKLVKEFKTPEYTAGQYYLAGANVKIDPSAVLHQGVVIGNNVKIGAYTVVYPNTVINSDSYIGDHVIIHPNCTLGGDAFYFKSRENGYEKLISCGWISLEDEVEIGVSCTIDKGVSGITRIGKGTKLDNHIHIGHGAELGERCLLAAHTGIGGKTILEDDVVLWGHVGINKDIRIGRGAEVYACSCVSKSIEGQEKYFGAPAVPHMQAFKEMAAFRKLPKWMKEVDQRIKQLLGAQ
jgi:UDP-3-O-[3-hydroxymyristoyl] glucosamine N-acyltransferase